MPVAAPLAVSLSLVSSWCCSTVLAVPIFFFPGDKSNPQHGFLPSGRDFDRQLGNGPIYAQVDSSVIPSRLRIPTRILERVATPLKKFSKFARNVLITSGTI